MEQEFKFCEVDGKPLVKVEDKGFSRETGERNYHMECPDGLCEHTGVGNWYDMGHDYQKAGFWSPDRCTKCGKLFPYYSYPGL